MGIVEQTLDRRRKTIERRIKRIEEELATYAGLQIELRACQSQLTEIDTAINSVKESVSG